MIGPGRDATSVRSFLSTRSGVRVSHSQITRTFQPARRSAAAFRRSRAAFSWRFVSQKVAFVAGTTVP